MEKFTKQILIALQQVQIELLDAEELTHPDSVEVINIDDLIRPSYSQRVSIPNLIKPLVRSLYELGFVGGIIINGKNNHIIDGWHRCQIWKGLGNINIPCFVLNINTDQERKLHLLLNKQISQFKASEFGFTSEFAGLDLIRDFGFTKTEFLTETSHDLTNCENNRVVKAGGKLITALPDVYHQKLNALKKQMPALNKSQVLIKLIDFYEQANS